MLVETETVETLEKLKGIQKKFEIQEVTRNNLKIKVRCLKHIFGKATNEADV